MSREKKQPEESSNDIPAWIVSFSDMVTLLLAFFVLLQAFANEQDDNKFFVGQGSFRNRIKGMGMPQWLWGRQKKVERDWFSKRYPDRPDPTQRQAEPIIDSDEEDIQRAFQELKQKLKNESHDLRLQALREEAMPFKFAANSSALSLNAKRYLDNLAMDMLGNLPNENIMVYIIGLAPDKGRSHMKQWILAAERAKAIENYLQQKLAGVKRKWVLHSWGGGEQFGQLPHGTHAGLIVMGAKHGG